MPDPLVALLYMFPGSAKRARSLPRKPMKMANDYITTTSALYPHYLPNFNSQVHKIEYKYIVIRRSARDTHDLTLTIFASLDISFPLSFVIWP